MLDKFQEVINRLWSAGEKAVDRIITKDKGEMQPNPATQQKLQDSFVAYATSKPAAYITKGARNFLNDTVYRRFDENKLKFQSPFIQDLIKDPRFANASKSLDQSFSEWVAPKIDWAKRIGNLSLDFTTRPVARLAANTVLSAADLVTPGTLPEFKTNDPAGKLLFGDVPVASFQTQTKNNSQWLQDMGMGKGLSNTLGFGGMAVGAVLDAPVLPGGGAKKKIASTVLENLDDVAEMAWKSTSTKDKLKALLTYKDQLIKSGFTADAVNRMTAKEGSFIIKAGMTPMEWAKKTADEAAGHPLWASFKEQFGNWVGKRQASKFEGIAQTADFKKLDELGTAGFDLIESGRMENHPVISQVREILDTQWKKLNDAGVRTGYVDNYLPHLFTETQSEAEIALGRRLSKSSKFSLPRILKDYKEGLAAGLHAKYNKLSDVVGAYVTSTEKTLADKEFFDWLRSNKVIMTATEINKLPKETRALFSDYVTINADRFGFDRLNQAYKAAPDIAGAIDNFLLDFGSNPSQKFGIVEKVLKAGAGINTALKNWKLSAGIPGTGVNSFGLMSVKRHMLAGNNPIKNLAEGFLWVLNPKSADQVLQTYAKEMPDAVKNGLVLSVEDMDFFTPVAKEYKNILTKSYGVVADKLSQWFEKPLFNNVLPAMKLKTYKQNIEIFLKQGLDEKSAKELSANVTNSIYGGLNLDRMMRDKGTQTLVRNLLLAPDLYESQYNVGAGLVNMFKKGSPEAKVYQLYARNLLMDLVNRNVANKVLSGHFMYENPEGEKLNLDTGTYTADGKKRTIKGYGLDAVKVPFDIMDALVHGDVNVLNRTVRNRLAPAFATAYGVATNTRYTGSPLYYPDATGSEKAAAIGTEVGTSLLPTQLSEPVQMLQGKQGAEETVLRMLELPIRYTGGAYSNKEKETTKLMQQSGMSGEEINKIRNEQRDVNNAPKLTTEQQNRNLKEGLNMNTERNWLGMPKDPQSSSNPAWTNEVKTSETTGNVGLAGRLAKGASDSASEREKNAVIKQIFETIPTDEGIAKALEANGITYRQGISYMMSQLGVEDGSRGEMIMSLLKETTSEDEFKATAINMAKEGLLTTGVTKQWLDDGIIGSDQKKFFDSLIKSAKGNTNSGTSSTKTKTFEDFYKAPKFTNKQITAKIPKLSSASTKPITAPKLTPAKQLPSMTEITKNPAQLAKYFPEVKFSQVPNYR